ncbi:MAG: ankyrin repeat domain-containing protein [Patescibacteria group bacterium]
MKGMSVVFAVFAIIVDSVSPASAQDVKSALQEARKKNYVVGERTGNPAEMRDNVRYAAEKVRAILRQRPEAAIEPDERGFTPLVTAAHYGYAEVVEALLESPLVVERIDAKDERGLSAYETASHMPAQTPWVCVPKIKENPFAFVPSYVQLPYYEEYDPYSKILTALKSKGSAGTPESERMSWLKYCKDADPEFREKIRTENGDLRVQLKAESKRILEAMANKK